MAQPRFEEAVNAHRPISTVIALTWTLGGVRSDEGCEMEGGRVRMEMGVEEEFGES